MWQTKYAWAVPKTLGLGFDFQSFSEGNFLTRRPESVHYTMDWGCYQSISAPYYLISLYGSLPRIIPAFLIMPAPGTLLCRSSLVISNNTRSLRPYERIIPTGLIQMLGCGAHVRKIALSHVRCACGSACGKGLEMCVRKCVRMGNFQCAICDRTFLLVCT